MPRTELMQRVQRMFRLARKANQPGAPPVDELLAIEREQSLSRRNFLKSGALMLGAGGLVTGCGGTTPLFTRTAPPPDNLQPSIAIVGAGIAGMNAAWQLAKAGFRADIYEAGNRVGGRMFTVSDVFGPGIATELGGEFIDSGHEEMLRLAGEFDLPLLDILSPSEASLTQTWFFGGVNLTDAEVVALFQPLEAQITADQNSLPDEIDFQTQDAAAIALDNLSLAQYLDQIGAQGTIRTILDVAYETEYGLDPSLQSALNFVAFIDPDTSGGVLNIFGDSDQRFKIIGGNQQLPQAIAARLASSSPVNLGFRLIALREVADGFVMTFDSPGGTVDINANFVILTVPFSVLRGVSLNVTLPPAVAAGIANLAYGTNSKLILGFLTRYWRQLGFTGLFFTDLAFQSGWDSSQLQPGNGGSLTLFLGGPPGVEVEAGSPEGQAAGFLPGVQQMYPGANNEFTGVVRRFVWSSFPLNQGSYSCFGPGQWTTLLGAENAPDGNLFFAGEHTSVSYSGYMEGGAESGRRAAEELLARLGVNVAPRLERHRLKLRRQRQKV
ncbi:MAG: hypothetical protein AMXMBFR33_60370 [Candidatus Xenobia bacterium]|jgi:monoamine oxidase